MSTRRRLVLLLGILVTTIAGGLWALHALKPSPYIAVAEARPEPPRKSSLGEGRKLDPPASRTPERVERKTVSSKEKRATPIPGSQDGTVTTITIETPSFEINKRFRSMEGPYAMYQVRVDGSTDPAPSGARELWWWKGARIEVLDEKGETMGPEFMCHLNVDVDDAARKRVLGLESTTRRLLTLTQGEMAFAVGDGVGVPVASDETWSFMFQVLNHNRDGLFHARQRLTLYFVRDADLFRPIDPLTFWAGSIWVPVEKANAEGMALEKKQCHCCPPLTRGLEATNNVGTARIVDTSGRTFVGHWVVPPGKSTWSYAPDSIPRLPQSRKLYATWTHVHPFAKEVRLTAHKPGCEPELVTKSTIESLEDGKVGLSKITSFSNKEGVDLPGDASFVLAVDYDNVGEKPQDSMTSLGMFVAADDWKRPAWASRAQNAKEDSCGLPSK